MDEQHDLAPDVTQPASYCTAVPRTGDRLADACPDCGHATAMHVGVDHCPVCEMVDLSQQARAAAVTHVVFTADSNPTHAEKAFAEVQRRHKLGLSRAPYQGL